MQELMNMRIVGSKFSGTHKHEHKTIPMFMAVSLTVKSKNHPNPHQLIDNKCGTTIQWVLFNYT